MIRAERGVTDYLLVSDRLVTGKPGGNTFTPSTLLHLKQHHSNCVPLPSPVFWTLKFTTLIKL